MKIFFYGRTYINFQVNTLEWWMSAPGGLGYTWAVNDVFADQIEERFGFVIPPENRYSRITEKDAAEGAVMVAIGGDGTFLSAVRELRTLPIPIVGINFGRLGFLAQIMPVDVPAALSDICNGRFTIEHRTMLTVSGDFGAGPEFPHALNEFALHRHTADIIEVACWVDGAQLPTARGDGTMVSTATGSTAYSLSAGGPIVTPDSSCFVVSNIAPHNFSFRPLVVPDTSELTLEVRTRGREVLASLDNTSYMVGDGARFTVKKADFSVFLMRIQNISFYDTLRDRIMWGLDRRDGILHI
jgi:NAD+ kinase